MLTLEAAAVGGVLLRIAKDEDGTARADISGTESAAVADSSCRHGVLPVQQGRFLQQGPAAAFHSGS